MFDGLMSRWTTPAAWDRRERVADLQGERQQLSRRQPTDGAQARRQRLAAEQLHHQVGRAIGQVPVVDQLDHVRVPGETERLGLATQAVGGDRVVGGGCAQELDGDGQAVAHARRLVDDTAGAGAHPLRQLVLPGDELALEVARVAITALAQAQCPLERLHAHGLRGGLPPPLAVPGAKAAQERAGRDQRDDDHQREDRRPQDERRDAEERADAAEAGDGSARIGHPPAHLVRLRGGRRRLGALAGGAHLALAVPVERRHAR